MINIRFWKNKKAETEAPAARPGKLPKKLGTFEVTREIGRGSMGVVYLGRDEGSNKEVAIKTMQLASEFDTAQLHDAKERFLREAEILTWLHHPDIVTIYDVGEEKGLAYIAMEYLKGVELTTYTTPNNLLPLPKLLEIMARSADALCYAHKEGHEKGVVHRDIKPGNIMYDPDTDTVKLTDFGISRLVNLQSTKVGLVLGTPLYMSPEQVMGTPVTDLSDLFSLGSTFYHLACGEYPFAGDSEFEVMSRIVSEPYRDIDSIKPGLPDCVRTIIELALKKKPEERYQSGSEMAEAFRSCAAQIK